MTEPATKRIKQIAESIEKKRTEEFGPLRHTPITELQLEIEAIKQYLDELSGDEQK